MSISSRRMYAVVIALFVGALIAVGLSGAAHNGDGSSVTFGHATGSTVQNADGSKTITANVVEPKSVDLTGKIQRVATGTTTKFRVLGGLGVWNGKIWWDDLGAGATWKTTNATAWNPGNYYEAITFVVHYGNGHCECSGKVAWQDETRAWSYDGTSGGPTTWFEPTQAIRNGQQVSPSGCVYLLPTGGSESGSC